MSISHFFIDRPIFAAVLSIIIVIVGAVAYLGLPVAQYPDVVPPTIVVRAVYPGANAQVVSRTVATPIEQEINGVEDMLYMSSRSTSDGTMILTVTFKLGTDLDRAQVFVQNRVAIAEPRLPETVRRIGVTVRKSSPDLLLVVHLLSPNETYGQLYISNYALLQIRDVVARVDGVGDVQMFGARDYSMRIWLDPQKIASLAMTAGDVVAALREQNIQVAAGTIGQQPLPEPRDFQLVVQTQGRLASPEEFEDIVVKSTADGRVTLLRDVARVELGAQDYGVNSYLSNQPAVAIAISQRPGSNAIATAEGVREVVAEMARDFPDGLEYQIVYDPTEFVEESIQDVIRTLFEAVGLVVVVMLVFLQNWRAAVIPLLAIPVSLIGTFAAMAILGFSLNNLSLFGLVLAIGIVVDDAIIVVENIERNLEHGLSPREAARKAMDEVGGAVIAATLVLGAVFVPTAFISGITGQFYRQFALTIAVSTFISLFVSLTLSPAMGAGLLRGSESARDWFTRLWDRVLGGVFGVFNRALERVTGGYVRVVAFLVRKSPITLGVYLALLVGTFFAFRQVPVGFIPELDQGYGIASIQLPDAASLTRTDAVAREVSDILLGIEGVRHAVTFAGFSGATRTNSSNAAAIFFAFEPFEDRTVRAPDLIAAARKRTSNVPGASIAIFNPPAVRGLGTAGGFTLQLQDRASLGFPVLQEVTDRLVAAGNADPGLNALFTSFRAGTPQLYAEIDRHKAKMMSVPLDEVFDALQVYLGSVYVNDFNYLGRTYQVRAQADGAFRMDESSVRELKARNSLGEMVPLGAVLELDRIVGPEQVVRYNMFPAAEINGSPALGFSSGDALSTMERIAAEGLPRGMRAEWTDLAFQQIQAGNTALFIFPLCVLFVFLSLAAQYESWSLPLAVILIVPMCLLSAIAGVWLRGMDNNILTQIGFVVLVALATKNAILIVEFAKAQQENGVDRVTAALEACRLRLRPILMTSFAFILGVVPLVIASGAGAEMRQALGTAVFSGMLGVTLFGLLLTPVFYVAIRGIVERRQAGVPVSEVEESP